MTKIIRIENLNFGLTTINMPVEKNIVVYNDGTENLSLDAVISNNALFSIQAITSQKLSPKMPSNSTIYFDSDGLIQNSDGEFYTSDLGYGIIGTTDSDGKLTINIYVETVEITAPLPDFYYEEVSSINITGNTFALTTVDLEYSIDGGSNWNTIINGLSCAGGAFSHSWTAPTLFKDESTIIRASGITQSDTVTGTLWVDSWIAPDLTIKGYLGTAEAIAQFVTVYNPEDSGIIGTADVTGTDLITVYNPEDAGIIGTATALAELV